MEMSQRQWKRLEAIERVIAGKLTGTEAATVLGLSERQVRRLRRAVEKRGAVALVHGNRGRAAPNRISGTIRERIVVLRRTTYDGFNDQHFTEKVQQVEGLTVSRASVRRVLREAGIGSPRKRRAPKHRRRRERKPQAGLMVLWDGSQHDWLEGRGPRLCLMGAIDDATSELLPGAHFVEQECAAGYLRTLQRLAAARGLPWSVYMDRHGSLARNDDHWTLAEELRGRQDPTQVGRALELLGIEAIYALSPQAKGRVERLWGTLQDRLVAELRLAGADTAAQANAVLEQYRPAHNRRFAVAAKEAIRAWRTIPRGVDLARVCSFAYEATVLNDNTVRLAGVVIDIPPGPRQRSYSGARVELRQLLDGRWRVYRGDQLLVEVAGTLPSEVRPHRRKKRPPSAAAAAKPPGARRAPSVSAANLIASVSSQTRGGQNC
jgi:transposase